MNETLTATELEEATLIFADGYSVSALMRYGGLRNCVRVATTDLIQKLLDSQMGNANFKIALIGGDVITSESAKVEWLKLRPLDQVMSVQGFNIDIPALLSDLNVFKPDLILVGMGMPLELKFLNQYRDQLPNGLYVTCGGYLRLLAKMESRSPTLLQNLKLEWLYRWVTDPKRTTKRYVMGLYNIALLLLLTKSKRSRN
jgi:N-acetylglucosaminyldiphosphoundecaprenol N-acetyl-beta-D-mannosaminyltransferase